MPFTRRSAVLAAASLSLAVSGPAVLAVQTAAAAQPAPATHQQRALLGLNSLDQILGGLTNGTGLPVSGALVGLPDATTLNGLLAALQGGQTLDGSLLSPVGVLLQSLANSGAIGNPQLVQNLLYASTHLVDFTTDQLAQLLTLVNATTGIKGTGLGLTIQAIIDLLSRSSHEVTGVPGTNTTTGASVGGGTPIVQGSSTTTTNTTSTVTTGTVTGAKVSMKRLQVKSVRFDRKRGRLVATVYCAKKGGNCAATLSALVGKKSVAKAVKANVKAGKTTKKTLVLTSAARKSLKKKSMSVKVSAKVGKTVASSRTVKLRAAR
jgi:hypothetical protein